MTIFFVCCQHNSVHCQLSITEVSEQDESRFTHKRKAVVLRRIRMILPQWATEFCKLTC